MFNFPLTKNLATTQDRQILQNSDEKQDCQFWILRLVVFTRFPENRDCLLKIYMLVKSARTVSHEKTGRHFTERGGKIALKITICSKNKQFALML